MNRQESGMGNVGHTEYRREGRLENRMSFYGTAVPDSPMVTFFLVDSQIDQQFEFCAKNGPFVHIF